MAFREAPCAGPDGWIQFLGPLRRHMLEVGLVVLKLGLAGVLGLCGVGLGLV